MKNLDILNCEQGSDAWRLGKVGVISASNISCVLAKKGTATRENYISELIAQVATGQIPEIDGPALRWGKENEHAARSAYEFLKGDSVEQVGFIYGKDRRIGASPDGIVTNKNLGLELKCPYTSKVHIDFLLMDKIKLEYIYQVQFSMFVTGLDQWDFASYDGRVRQDVIKIHTIERDLALMERFENEVGEFIAEMDRGLEKLQIKWGSQWL
jgi:putative phage-type endonuclease